MNRPLHLEMALAIGMVFMVVVPARATILYLDTGTAAGIQPASGTSTSVVWGTDNIWTIYSGGTNAPGAWTPNSDAYFSQAGAATVTVNSVSANSLNFAVNSGTTVLRPGTGSLQLANGITNGVNAWIGCDIDLGGNQTWAPSGNYSLTVTGAIRGAYALTVKPGPYGWLILSNTVSTTGGMTIDSPFVIQGGTVKNASGAVTLPFGSGNMALNNTTLMLAPGAGTPAYLGATNAGAAFRFGTNAVLQLSAGSGSNLSYTIGPAGAAADSVLLRSGKGALIIQYGTSLGGNEKLLVNGGLSTLNGMLPPYIIRLGTSYDYVNYLAGGGFTNAAYDLTNPTSGGSGTQKLNFNTGLSLTGPLAGYVANVAGGISVNLSGNQLTLGDGINPTALSMDSGAQITNGTLTVNGNTEFLVAVNNASTVGATIQSTNLLNKIGLGTLTLSNANLYAGPMLLQGGGVSFFPTGNATYAGSVDGPGTWTKLGPNTLTYTGTNTMLGTLILNGGTFTISGGRVTDYGTTFTSGMLVITNGGFFRAGAPSATAFSTPNSYTTNVIVSGASSTLDASAGYLNVGIAGTTGSVVLVDGGTITNVSVAIPQVSGANFCALIVTNGGAVRSFGTFAIGRGAGNTGNYAVFQGANGNTPSTLFNNGAAFYIGLAANTTGNWMRVDNGGAVTNIGTAITIGAGSSAVGNYLIVANGGRIDTVIAAQIGRASPASGNYLAVTNGGVVTILGASIGAAATYAGMTGNYVRVDNGTVNSGAGAITIGTMPSSVGNYLSVVNSGQVFAASLSLGGASGGNGNWVQVMSGGLLECGNYLSNFVGGAGNTISNLGGIFQFTSATPTVVPNGTNNLVISNGSVSFRGVTTADVFCNQSGKPLDSTNRMAWLGANGFRLNASTNLTTGQDYTFTDSMNPTNFARLELFNGSRYNGNVTLGNNGVLMTSGSASTITGALTVVSTATLNMTVSSANDYLAVGGAVNLGNATLQLTLKTDPTLLYPIHLVRPAGGLGGTRFGTTMVTASYGGKSYDMAVKYSGTDVVLVAGIKGTALIFR